MNDPTRNVLEGKIKGCVVCPPQDIASENISQAVLENAADTFVSVIQP
jgi:hypothetical protein